MGARKETFGSLDAQLILARCIEQPNGCYTWTGATDGDGYGMVTMDGRTYRTHRVILSHLLGKSIAGQCALHSCDNPSCCNPSHLFLGTRPDNVTDMVSKNRQAKGERMGPSRLLPQHVKEIRAHRRGYGQNALLAKQFNVSKRTIGDIMSGRTWKHI